MNETTEDHPIHPILKMLIEQGFGGMDQAMTILVNEAVKVERFHALPAKAYERTPDRLGQKIEKQVLASPSSDSKTEILSASSVPKITPPMCRAVKNERS